MHLRSKTSQICSVDAITGLSGRVLDSRPRGRRCEPHRCHCVMSLSKNINPSLVQEDLSLYNRKIVDGTYKIKSNKRQCSYTLLSLRLNSPASQFVQGCTGLDIKTKIQGKIVNIFLPIIFSIYFGSSKELSQ